MAPSVFRHMAECRTPKLADGYGDCGPAAAPESGSLARSPRRPVCTSPPPRSAAILLPQGRPEIRQRRDVQCNAPRLISRHPASDGPALGIVREVDVGQGEALG